MFVAAIFCQEAGRSTRAADRADSAPSATPASAAAGSAGRDGWWSQVSKSAASGLPETRSAYRTKSPTFALPYACSAYQPFSSSKKVASPTSLRSAWSASAPRS